MVDIVVKAFGASNLLVETNLRRIQEVFEVDLGKGRARSNQIPDVRLRFPSDIRRDSEIMARYYAIFHCIERQTREIVRDRLSEKLGVDWWLQGVSGQIRNDVESRLKREIDAGIALRSTEQIEYTTFGELAQIIEANWDHFTDTFRNRKATSRALSQLNLLRGPIAHNSTFVESEGERFNIAIEDWLRQQILES